MSSVCCLHGQVSIVYCQVSVIKCLFLIVYCQVSTVKCILLSISCQLSFFKYLFYVSIFKWILSNDYCQVSIRGCSHIMSAKMANPPSPPRQKKVRNWQTPQPPLVRKKIRNRLTPHLPSVADIVCEWPLIKCLDKTYLTRHI